jgi:RNA polymerase sigma factor (sigma-70 family)
MVTFQIQNNDGTLSSISRKEFYEVLRGDEGYLCYEQGGCHIAMLPTASVAETICACRQADNAENHNFATESRCLDEKGHLCRYQHDEKGRVIRNEKGNPISAKCGDCPKNGWAAGKRENCCIRNYCKTVDCTYCPYPREYRVPLSLERFVEDNEFDEAGYVVADETADIQAALESNELNASLLAALNKLPANEQALLRAVYWDKLSLRAYGLEFGIPSTTVKRHHKRALATLKKILKNFC